MRMRDGEVFAGMSRNGMAWFAGVGVCNGFAVLTIHVALARGRVTLVAPSVTTYPLVTVVLSALFLSYIRLTQCLFAGIIVTASGVAPLLAD